jgi:hypothetical protein
MSFGISVAANKKAIWEIGVAVAHEFDVFESWYRHVEARS